LEQELIQFPNSKHDDPIDAYAYALDALFKRLSWWRRLLNWIRRRFRWITF